MAGAVHINQGNIPHGNSQGTRHTMKQLLEFVPIALFFIVYQLNGETLSLAGWSYTCLLYTSDAADDDYTV